MLRVEALDTNMLMTPLAGVLIPVARIFELCTSLEELVDDWVRSATHDGQACGAASGATERSAKRSVQNRNSSDETVHFISLNSIAGHYLAVEGKKRAVNFEVMARESDHRAVNAWHLAWSVPQVFKVLAMHFPHLCACHCKMPSDLVETENLEVDCAKCNAH